MKVDVTLLSGNNVRIQKGQTCVLLSREEFLSVAREVNNLVTVVTRPTPNVLSIQGHEQESGEPDIAG